MRINKWLAEATGVSRRRADYLIEAGQIRINGNRAKLGDQVNLTDQVSVNGKIVELSKEAPKRYVLVNKDQDTITTTRDDRGRRTVMGLVPADLRKGLKPVGRLDINTTGVVLLTDDGELAYKLTHPRFKVEKKYWAWIKGQVLDLTVKRIKEGVRLSDGYAKPKAITKVRENERECVLEITMIEGRKREVRRMIEAAHLELKHLKRVEFAGLKVESIPEEGYRELTQAEVETLRKLQNIG